MLVVFRIYWFTQLRRPNQTEVFALRCSMQYSALQGGNTAFNIRLNWDWNSYMHCTLIRQCNYTNLVVYVGKFETQRQRINEFLGNAKLQCARGNEWCKRSTKNETNITVRSQILRSCIAFLGRLVLKYNIFWLAIDIGYSCVSSRTGQEPNFLIKSLDTRGLGTQLYKGW